MLKILPYDEENYYRTITHDDNVFHKALRFVLNGEKRFHVKHPGGKDYDLLYMENNDIMKRQKDKVFFPPFYLYDETRTEDLYFQAFDGLDTVSIEGLNEYTVVISKLLLAETGIEVYVDDADILMFVEPHERLHINEEIPEGAEVMVYKPDLDSEGPDAAARGIVPAFLALFFFQWLTDLPLKDVRYMLLAFGREEGIGSVLEKYSYMKCLMNRLGIRLVLDRSSLRYTEVILKRYFVLEDMPDDMDETNTIYVTNFYPIIQFTPRYSIRNYIDEGIFNPKFLAEMKEYADAVLGGRKMIGVLMRGSDYIVTGMVLANSHRQVSMEYMISTLREKLDNEGYEGIFLATEDSDILARMREAFPEKLRAVSQERYSVSDFTDVEYITDLDRKKHAESERERALDDITGNYMYALYTLSRCDLVMASGASSGFFFVRELSQSGIEPFILRQQE